MKLSNVVLVCILVFVAICIGVYISWYRTVPSSKISQIATTPTQLTTPVVEPCIDEDTGEIVAMDTATQFDLNYCAAQRQALAEEKMQSTYQALIAQIASNIAKDKNDPQTQSQNKKIKAELISTEKTWNAYATMQCATYGLLYEGGSIQPMIVAACRTTLAKQHTQTLAALLAEMQPI